MFGLQTYSKPCPTSLVAKRETGINWYLPQKDWKNGQSEQKDRRPCTTISGDICSQRLLATWITAFRLRASTGVTGRSLSTYFPGSPARHQHLRTSPASIGGDCIEFLDDLGRRITQVTDDNREKAFLYQRLSLMIQR